MGGQVIVISGASSGIGRRTAGYLAQAGHTVYGTSRHPSADHVDGFHLLPLDVTDESSVQACVRTVIEREGRIDVLVANAGVDLFGALEETTTAEAQRVFDVNFFGVARLVQAALPFMRAQRAGRIILIGSALGRAAWPFEGMYCASKFALEGYAETLCYEMNLFGIHVSSIQPGFFKSQMIAHQGYTTPIPDYQSARDHALRLGEAWAGDAPDPLPVAQAVERIMAARQPALRYAVGLEAHLTPPIAQLLPLGVRFKVGRWLLGVDDPRRDIARYGLAALIALAGGVVIRLLWQGDRRHAHDEL